MKQLKTVMSVLFFLAGFGSLFAQEVVSSSGGSASGMGGTVSYTIGQVSFMSYSGTNGSAWQGVQHGYEIKTGIEESLIQIELTAYPNPTSDFLYLRIKNYENRQMVFNLFDMQGKLLLKENIFENLSIINMGDYLPSTYILTIQDIKSNKKLKTVQIIKK